MQEGRVECQPGVVSCSSQPRALFQPLTLCSCRAGSTGREMWPGMQNDEGAQGISQAGGNRRFCVCVITQECPSFLCEGRFLIQNGPSARVSPVLPLVLPVHSCDGDPMLQGFGAFPAFSPPMPGWPCALSPWFWCWFSPICPSTAWLELLQALPLTCSHMCHSQTKMCWAPCSVSTPGLGCQPWHLSMVLALPPTSHELFLHVTVSCVSLISS